MAVWRPAPEIRVVALAVIWRGDQLLLEQVEDDSGAVVGWRPLGGRIEFGERATTALQREFREELGAPIELRARLSILENLFEHHGARGHEIMFVYEAAFTLPHMYDRDEYLIIEGETSSVARWMGLEEFRSGRTKLFPAGLTDILARERDFARSTAAFEVGEAK